MHLQRRNLQKLTPFSLMLVHCSMLAEDAIKSAISNYRTKNPKAAATDLGGTSAAMPKVEVETIMDRGGAASSEGVRA